MWPEQACGHELDARTDIFSLGALLFEMVTGRPAFPGATPAEVFASLLGQEPAASASGALDAVFATALAKDPAASYQAMKEFAEGLRNLALKEKRRLPGRGAHAARIQLFRVRERRAVTSLRAGRGVGWRRRSPSKCKKCDAPLRSGMCATCGATYF